MRPNYIQSFVAVCVCAVLLFGSINIYAYDFGAESEHFKVPRNDKFNDDTQNDLIITPITKERTDKNTALTPPIPGVYGGEIQTEFINELYDNEPLRRTYVDIPKSKYATEAEEVIAKIKEQGIDAYGRPLKPILPDSKIVSENKTYGRSTGAFISGQATTIIEPTDSSNKIGTLVVPTIDFTLNVYNNAQYSTMLHGVGIVEGTSMWDGNVAMAGHNRGGFANVDEFKYLNIGDKLKYTTAIGTRVYSVVENKIVKVTDTSVLDFTPHNQLTLITCIAGDPSVRLCVTAIEDIPQ